MMNAAAAGLLAALMWLTPGTWFPRQTASPQAVSAFDAGVWWKGQQKIGPNLTPPQHVQKGGLWVSSNPAGTVALSAVRFTVGPDDHQPILNLAIDAFTTAPSQVPADLGGAILGCVATASWKAPAAGPFGSLDAAPAYRRGKTRAAGQGRVERRPVRQMVQGRAGCWTPQRDLRGSAGVDVGELHQ